MRCRRGNTHFDIHFRWIMSVHFLSENGKDASDEGRNGREGVLFPTETAFQPLMLHFLRILFPICTLEWRLNCYVSRHGKNMNKKGESTKRNHYYCYYGR